MAFALQGALGPVATGSVNAALTPSWDAGATRYPGNLLVCWCWAADITTATAPATVTSGWTSVGGLAANPSINFFYKTATGGDAAPTITAAASSAYQTFVAEFSGNATPVALDQSNRNRDTGTGARSFSMNRPDAVPGELLIQMAIAAFAATTVDTVTITPIGFPVWTANNNDGANATIHYSAGFGIAVGSPSTGLQANTTNARTSFGMIAATFIPSHASPPQRAPFGM